MLLYTLVLRLYSFLNPTIYSTTEDTTALAELLLSGIGNFAWIHSILACLMCYVIGVLMSQLANKGRIFKKQNLYPGFFFVIFSSLVADFQVLSPALIASLLFVFFVQACMKIYRNHYSALDIFNVGLFAALATLIYVHFSILLVASFIGLLYFKSTSLKDILKLLFGALSAFIICISLCYYFDLFSFDFLNDLGRSKYLFSADYLTIERCSLILALGLFLIIGIISYDSYQKKKIIDARKKITFLYILLVFLLPIPLIFNSSDIYSFLGLCVIVSFFAGLAMDYYNNILFTETLHLALLVILFGFQFNLINL